MAPIDYPHITLGGQEFVFRVSLAALRRLEESGITAGTPAPADMAALGRYIAAQASALAHVVDQATGRLKHAGVSIEEMQELIDIGDIPDVRRALEEALVKAPRTPEASPSGEPQRPN